MATLPSAVVRNRERLEAEEKAKQPPVTPAVVNEVKQEVQNTLEQIQEVKAIAPDDFEEQLKALEAKYKTDHGRVAQAQSETIVQDQLLKTQEENQRFLAEKLQALTDENNRLKAQLENAPKQNSVPQVNFEPGITDEDLKDFDPNQLRIVQGLSRKELKVLEPILKSLVDKQAELDAKLNEVSGLKDNVASIQEHTNKAALIAAQNAEINFFRDAFKETPHKNWETFVKTTPWKNLMSSKVPGGSHTYGQLMNAYREQRNVAGIYSVFDAFRSYVKNSGNVNALTEPTSKPAIVNTNTAPTKKFKVSEYNEKLSKMTRGLMDRTEFFKFSDEFKKAFKNGEVEQDVPT